MQKLSMKLSLAEILVLSAIAFGFLLMAEIVVARLASSDPQRHPCECSWAYRDRRCEGYYSR